ncbi:hypothetical protein J3459_012092 [Metarhizium acridum]|uniref:uncharacterized protein n=1 Tax=Metarhizium acridum TaxID=92637 RepID=UPI001C6C8B9A|nr:hypothetical protein J3458_021972 [Metarhizium acridum]KAG8418726.1 hypothetical protein J3459_012092 [Metarhizium acridum]
MIGNKFAVLLPLHMYGCHHRAVMRTVVLCCASFGQRKHNILTKRTAAEQPHKGIFSLPWYSVQKQQTKATRTVSARHTTPNTMLIRTVPWPLEHLSPPYLNVVRICLLSTKEAPR